MTDLEKPGNVKIVCAWCRILMSGNKDAQVTDYAICEGCKDRLLGRKDK